ncbi:MAG: efflux RND transporter periplasmic adaptor subunit [Candidatus Levybacteria bacterium]|nr:efflux RND transporter periplasmic adaptor subunit [Candidatus Levybacteria bacterium]
MKIKRRYFLLTFGILAIFLLYTNTLGIKSSENPQTYTVERKSLVQSFSASGNIEAKDSATLHFSMPGKIVWIGVDKGSQVYAGQALAYLDTTELQASMRQAEQDFIAAKAVVEKTYDETGRKTDESFSEKVKRTAAEATQNKAYDNIKKVEKQLADSALVSPINGVVTSVNFSLGENISGADTITIIGPKSFRFVANVDEADFADVSQNQKAHVKLDAFGNKTLDGKVVLISPQVLTSASGASVVPVDIEILDTHTSLIAGLSGEAEFIQSEVENVLVVSRKATFSEGNEIFVYVVKEGKKEKRKITVGKQTEKEAQVLSGVSEEDQVLANPK